MIGTIICSAAVGAGIGAFGAFILGSAVSRNGRSGSGAMDDLSSLSSYINDTVKSAENLRKKADDRETSAGAAPHCITDHKSDLETAVFELGDIYRTLEDIKKKTPKRAVQSSPTAAYTAQALQKPAPLQQQAAPMQTPLVKTPLMQQTSQFTSVPSGVTNIYGQQPNAAQPSNAVQPAVPSQQTAVYNTQPVEQNPAYREIAQPTPVNDHLPECIIAVNELFERVKQLQNSSHQYRVYNVGTSRLEFSSDPSAQYICEQSDLNAEEYYVLPNQTDFFKTLSLSPDVFSFSGSMVTDQYRIRLAVADSSGNICEKGEIMKL